MGEWLIYGSNGSQKATVKKLEYSGEFMGETSVTCDIYSPSPISFSIGDYLVYRGERFTIDYDATRLKQARNNTYGKGYTYENMRFLSYVGELKKCEFLDFVPSDNLIHFSQLPDFSFYAETVKDLADRIQANLDRIYTGGKAWTVQVVQGFEGKENINVSVSKSTCFDALRMAYEQFEATFIIRGRTITIGTAGNELETDFRYGKGNGLKTIERSVDESDAIVTRLRAYGNTTNMPANYYKNIGMRVYAPIYEIYHVSTIGCDIHFVPKLKNACFNDKNGQYQYWVSVSLDETLWLKAVASPNTHLSSTNYSVVTVGLYDGNTQAMVTQFNTQLQSGTYNRLYFKQGINVGAWPIEYREYAENVPDLMAIDRLMLPGFPELTTDPYIDSSNIATLGVREKSVYFDGSDPDTPDIHPTLEGMTAAELRAAGYVIDLDSGDNGNLDEIAADATETDGSPITADGAFEGVDEVPGFKVTIKDIGFDINDYLSTETATLVMKTGMCGGMEFTIVKVDKVGNKYVLECQRTEDVAHYFPYNPYLIKAGDKFVLTNLEMPKAYIDAASQRLLTAAQEYIAKYSEPQWVYAIKMDDIWMQKQRDNSVSEASSYYWNIKEGDVMNVTDSDLGVDIAEVIDRLSIREGFGPIPEFEVVLRKEKPQGTIGVLQNRIRQLELRNAEQVSTIYRQQNYIDLIIGDKINDIQNQLDHVQVTYFGDYAPTLSNEPASTWQSSEYSEHDGDMFYNRTTGKGYEFTYKNGTWGWIEIQDEDIRQALEEAAAAQDTADGKRRVFVTPAGTLPTPPYDENDLWVNATYPSNSTSTDESQHKYYNDILKCVTPKAEGGTASINDWTLASKYTDDSSLNAFINGSYADDLEDIQTQLDGKAETWYQSTDPSTAWTTTALKNQHKGDIWHNSSNTTINGVKAGQDAIWNGTAWVVDETVPQSVYDTIDGKAAIYVTWGAWGNDLQVKDLFIPSANTTQGGVTYKANKVYRCTNKSTPTFQEIAYTDDAALNAFLNGYTGTLTGIRTDISNAQTTANNANTAAAAAQATADALDYLKQAYSADNTLIDHGLILSTIVALRDSSNNVWSGISGAYDSTKLGNGIAAWYGGGMIDKEVSAVSNAAKSLFRFDGSGYVASGNLKWDANGNVTIQGYSINATTLQVGGANVATQAMLDNFVSKSFFNRLFTAYDANGNAIVPNNTTTAINNLKIMVGTWTEQYLSALGLNSEGGGGGTGDVSHIKIGTNPDVFLDPDEDGIIDMSSYAANWNDAYQKRHTHSNKSVLDGITSTKVSHWDAVYGVVPSAAYETGNSLADKNFVNSSISTSTATFRGTNTTATTESAFLTWANGLTHDLNDYVFWSTKDSAGNTIYKRYKYDGSQWVFEYDLNNSSFTSDQWSAINSGITSTHVSKLNGIASGAQVNVIESVKVNGTALSISSKAVDITEVPLTIITGADDLKAIEGLSGTGFLKRTGNNTWALDTTVVLSTRKVSTGNGLQGGGDLSADRTISILLPTNSGLSVASTGLKLDIVNNLTTASDYRAISATQAKKIWDLLNQMFTLEGAGTTASPYVIKANYGLYTEQFLSALGQNSEGGSGGGMGEDEMWAALQANSGTYENAKINWNHIPLATTSTAGAIKVGSTLAISNGILNQATIPNFTADVYTKVTVDTYGRVTQGGDLLADDIPTLSMSKISGLSTALGNVYTKTESDAKYVTALGTSGNSLTWTKNGNTTNITVPFATSATTATKLGSATVGSSVRPIYLNAGVPTQVSSVESTLISEPSYVAADVTPTTYSIINTVKTNRFVCIPADQIIIEKTTDGGATWVDYGASNAQKEGLFMGSFSSVYITIPKINGEKSKLCGIRITITGMKYNVPEGTPETQRYNYWNSNYYKSTERYCSIESVYFWMGVPYDRIRTRIYVAKGSDANNWIRADRGDSYLSGNSGGNIVFTDRSVTGQFGGYEGQTGNKWNYRFEFFTDGLNGADLSSTSSTSTQSIQRIQGFGRNGWISPNNLFSHDHIYTWDINLRTFFPSHVSSASNNVYDLGLSTARWRNVYATNLNLNGAITGATTGAFSSNVTIGGHLYFGNAKVIYFKNRPASGTAVDMSVIDFTSTNQLLIGHGTATYGYDTYIKGYNVYLTYGSSKTTGFTLDSSGNTTLAGGLYLQNAKPIYIKDNPTSGTASYKNVFELSASNNLRVGYGTSEAGYNTYIEGNQVYLTYGTSRTVGLSLYSNGTTALASHLSMGNDKVIYFSDNPSSGSSAYSVDSLRLSASNNLLLGHGTSGKSYSTFLYGNIMRFHYGTSRTVGMVLAANGNVGIGSSTSPSYKLDVQGDLGVASGITLTTTKKIKFGTANDAPYIELDSNGYFHFSAGLYSDSFVSALGANDQGGGGSTFDEDQMWRALNSSYDDNHLEIIDDAHLPNLDASKITSGTFNASRIPTLPISKISGLQTALDSFATQTWVNTQLGNYVTLGTAQTITGAKTFNEGKWIIASQESNEISSKYWDGDTLYNNANTSVLSKHAAIKNAIRFRWYDSYWNIGNIRSGNTATYGFGIALEDTTNSRLIDCLRVTQGGTYIQGYTALHAGNSYVTNGKGYINGAEITTITGNAATATKLGTSTVGSSTAPIYLNSGVPTASTANFIFSGDVLQTTNPFTPLKKLYISKIDNAFYAAEKRFTVTGEIIDGSTTTEIPQSTLHNLFDGSYETSFGITNGKTAKIHIRFDGYSNSAFPGYPYGFMFLSFYHVCKPTSVSARCYCNYQPQGIGWHDMSVVNYSGGNGASNLYRVRNDFYNIQEFEFTIVGDTTNSYGYTALTQIEMNLDRPDSSRTPFLSKYAAETLYYPLTIESSLNVSEDVILNNNRAIYFKDTNGTARQSLYFDSNNNLLLGGGVSPAGYNTYIEGNNIYLRYGTSHATGLSVASNGNVYIPNTLSVDGTITNKYLAIAESWTDTWSDGTHTHPWYGIDGRWNNTGVYSTTISDYYGMTLKTERGNISMKQDGNVGIGNTAPTSKLHVTGTFNATGATTLGSTLVVTGATTLTGLLTANGGIVVPSGKTIKIGDCTIEWDSTNQMLKFDKGIYSTGAVSALGSNDEGGGSSDFSEELMWAALQSNTGTYANTKIDANHIPDTSSLYGYLKSSSLSGYVNAVSTSGSGNAVTSVTKSGNTITFTKGSTFLTSHQTLYTLSIYGGTTKVLDFKPNANASIYIKAGGDISLTNDTTNKYITLSYTHPTNGANTTISAANGKVLSAITVNSLGHVTSVSSKTLAAADIPDISATYATASRATTLEGYFTDGVANNAAKLNGQAASYYATASSVTTLQGYFTDGVAKVAAKLNTGTTTYTAWGQTYWSSGVPQSVSGNMTDVGTISASGNISVTKSTTADSAVTVTNSNGSIEIRTSTNRGIYDVTGNTWVCAIDGTNTFMTKGNVGIGTTEPTYKLHVAGTFRAGGNSSIGGTFGVTGATTLSSTLGVTGATTLTGLLTANGNIKTGTSNGAYIQIGAIKLVYDSTNNALKVIKSDDSSANFYATGAVSALGANSSGGGGDFDEDSMWAALGTTSSAQVIASSHIPNLSWNKITSNKPTTLSGYGITDAFTQTQSFDKFYSLYGGKAIEASSSNAVDLDNLTTSGSYYCETNTASGYVTHKPTDRNIAFRIWVSKPTGTTSGYVRQRFQYYDQVAVYERIDTNLSSVSWGNWYKVQDSLADYASASSLNDYLPLSGGQMTGVLTWKNSTALSGVTSTSYVLCIDGFADGGATHYISTSNLTVGNATNATSATTASKLSTVSKTAWGQTYWTSGGVPDSISGNMSNVGNITMDGYLYMASQNRVYFKSSGNTDMIAMYETAANHLYIGYGFASEGYSTYIAGNTVELRYGTSRTTGLTLDGGDVTVKGKVCVGTGGADSYIASDSATNIFLRNSSGAVLVCDGKVVRRSTSLADVTLGSSTYPWGGVYSTTGTFSSNVSVGGTLGVTGATTLSSTLSVSGEVTMSSNLTVTGWVRPIGNLVMGTSSNSINANSTQIHFRTSYMDDFTKNCSPYIQAIGGGSYGRKRLSVFQNNGTSSDYNVAYSEVFTILANGRVGIGNTTPGALLGVSGDILASGEITASSDERKKNIISDTKFNVRDIASARSILYEWNDDRDKDNEKKIHGGSIAQDWLGKADSFLSQDNDGWYSINYGALALCSAITIAREVLKHSDEIDRLKQEVSYLKAKVAELEERRVA